MAVKSLIKPSEYHDSVSLMLAAQDLARLPGVVDASIVMATEANKALLKTAGLLTPEAEAASPNDLVIALDLQPSSPGVLRACRRTREVGARLVVITDSDASLTDIRPDLTITAATVSGHGHASHTGLLAVLECILAGLTQRSGIEAESRLRLYETLRRQAHGA